ncbi:MAG: hypothetical protein IKF65_04360, partial [Clostridia bacterium]|nr:hypothetical protein [Clostridia bacterium]
VLRGSAGGRTAQQHADAQQTGDQSLHENQYSIAGRGLQRRSPKKNAREPRGGASAVDLCKDL